jgi:L-ascorbate metabolism protein UlaG (beta-lactamase superfamily)
MTISIKGLGQSGFRLHLGGTIIYTDPYLSNYVEEVDGDEFKRLIAIPVAPEELNDAHSVLVSHIHMDHCDPRTLIPLSKASPSAVIVAPGEVCRYLFDKGIPLDRLITAPEDWYELSDDLLIKAVPAAHPKVERDENNHLRYVGYLLRYKQYCIYHAGDTSPDPELIAAVKQVDNVDIAFLPVNERNYYRDKRGIIGNMSIREAFQLAIDIGATTVIPVHWDMFAPNSVFREEIELLYKLIRPPFRMVLKPEELEQWT